MKTMYNVSLMLWFSLALNLFTVTDLNLDVKMKCSSSEPVTQCRFCYGPKISLD